MVYTPAMYRIHRDALLQHMLAVLRADERFVAAWLTGSLARGEGDDLSDLDLSVVVADAYTTRLTRRSKLPRCRIVLQACQLPGDSSSSRLGLSATGNGPTASAKPTFV